MLAWILRKMTRKPASKACELSALSANLGTIKPQGLFASRDRKFVIDLAAGVIRIEV